MLHFALSADAGSMQHKRCVNTNLYDSCWRIHTENALSRARKDVYATGNTSRLRKVHSCHTSVVAVALKPGKYSTTCTQRRRTPSGARSVASHRIENLNSKFEQLYQRTACTHHCTRLKFGSPTTECLWAARKYSNVHRLQHPK